MFCSRRTMSNIKSKPLHSTTLQYDEFVGVECLCATAFKNGIGKTKKQKLQAPTANRSHHQHDVTNTC